jgi:uncharacterized membrane protein
MEYCIAVAPLDAYPVVENVMFVDALALMMATPCPNAPAALAVFVGVTVLARRETPESLSVHPIAQLGSVELVVAAVVSLR